MYSNDIGVSVVNRGEVGECWRQSQAECATLLYSVKEFCSITVIARSYLLIDINSNLIDLIV